MFTDHKYLYLFIGFPITGSINVSEAMVKTYSGERSLSKYVF